MFASRSLRNAAMELLAADTATLAPAADAIYMGLSMANFVPSEATVFADITLATFDGYAEKAVTLNAQPEGFEPGTDDSVIDISPPVGGFRWETTGVTNLPQTIYGYVLLDHAKTTVLASALFETPIVLTGVNQRVDDLKAKISMPANSLQ